MTDVKREKSFVCDVPAMAKVVKVRENRWEFWLIRLQMFVSNIVSTWLEIINDLMEGEEYGTTTLPKLKYIQSHVGSRDRFRHFLSSKNPVLEKEIAMAINAKIDQIEYGVNTIRPGEHEYTIDIYTHLWEFVSMMLFPLNNDVECNEILSCNIQCLILTYIIFK